MEKDWSNWPQEYYDTTDREERKNLLQQRLETPAADKKDEIRMKFGNDKITRASIMNSNARIGRKARAQMKNEDRKEQ